MQFGNPACDEWISHQELLVAYVSLQTQVWGTHFKGYQNIIWNIFVFIDMALCVFYKNASEDLDPKNSLYY
jgi:hypothetical protein